MVQERSPIDLNVYNAGARILGDVNDSDDDSQVTAAPQIIVAIMLREDEWLGSKWGKIKYSKRKILG